METMRNTWDRCEWAPCPVCGTMTVITQSFLSMKDVQFEKGKTINTYKLHPHLYQREKGRTDGSM